MTTDEDPIDAARLAELMDLGDAEFVGELAQMYLADLGPRLDELDRSVAAGDEAAGAAVAHSLAGSSANMGLTKLAAIAKQVERRQRGDETGPVEPLLAELHLRAMQAERRLQGLIAGASASGQPSR